MPLDPRISLEAKAPDIYGAVQQGRQDAMQNTMNQAKVDDIPRQQQMQQLQDAQKKVEMTSQLLGSAVDQPSYEAAKAKAMQMGLDVSQEPPVFDPNHIRQSQMALLNVKDKIELELKKALNDARVTTEGAQAGAYQSLAGQRDAAAGAYSALGDQRQAAAGAQDALATQRLAPAPNASTGGILPPPAVVSGTMSAPPPMGRPQGKAPAGYRWNADGSALEPIPGGPKDPKTAPPKPLTEAQSNAATYAPRLVDSDAILSKLEDKGYVPNPLKTTIGESDSGNYITGDDTQSFLQARRNFINATLRRESGATINPSEFDSANKQYFPMPGDGKVVLEQKAQNRKRAIEGMTLSAGPSFKLSSSQGSTGNALGVSTIPHDAIDAELAKRGVK